MNNQLAVHARLRDSILQFRLTNTEFLPVLPSSRPPASGDEEADAVAAEEEHLRGFTTWRGRGRLRVLVGGTCPCLLHVEHVVVADGAKDKVAGMDPKAAELRLRARSKPTRRPLRRRIINVC